MHQSIEFGYGDGVDDYLLPSHEVMARWIAIARGQSTAAISVQFVDAQEIQTLNAAYRQKNKATNILSFPADLPTEFKILGDLAVCVEVLVEEAAAQAKTLEAHLAHLLVHGTLHLLGYDHIDDQQAQEMEALEIKILAELDIANPYISLE